MFGIIFIKKLLERIENIYNSCAMVDESQPGRVPEYTAIYNIVNLSQSSGIQEDGFPLLPVLLDVMSQCLNLIEIRAENGKTSEAR
jgi:hypothetical protein